LTNIDDSATDHILCSKNVLGIVELGTEFPAVKLIWWHGVEGLDIATLLEKTLDLNYDRMGLHWWLRRIAVVVSADDNLSCILGDQGWVSALVGSNSFEFQWEDTSMGGQVGSNMVSSLRITNVTKQDSEETTSNNLGSVD